MNTLSYLDARQVTNKDIISYHRKAAYGMLADYKSKHPNTKLSTVANELGMSVSSVKRYSKDLGLPPSRKTHNYTPEERKSITLKAQTTRLHTKCFNEISQLDSEDDNYDNLVEDIKSKYNKKIELAKSKYSNNNTIINMSSNTSRKSRESNPRGGTFHSSSLAMKATDSDDDEPRVITEEEAQRRIQQNTINQNIGFKKGITQGDAEKLADKYLKDV